MCMDMVWEYSHAVWFIYVGGREKQSLSLPPCGFPCVCVPFAGTRLYKTSCHSVVSWERRGCPRLGWCQHNDAISLLMLWHTTANWQSKSQTPLNQFTKALRTYRRPARTAGKKKASLGELKAYKSMDPPSSFSHWTQQKHTEQVPEHNWANQLTKHKD